MTILFAQAAYRGRESQHRVSRLWPVVCTALALLLCGAAYAQNPVPQIANPLVPNSAAPGAAGLTLTVNGTGFLSTSVVNWNGSALATMFLSGTQLQATVPSSNLATAGTASVTVANTGSPASAPAYFTIARTRLNVGFSMASFPVGTNPIGVAVGDFNHDGKLDLAIANNGGTEAVMIFLGNGDGTFTPGNTYTLTGFPINIVTADLNNDGNLDLIVADQQSSKVVVLLGVGDGTFGTPQYYPTGGHPMSLAFGDFNCDGKIDIATPNFADNTVSILLGNGDGTFQTKVSYTVGTGPLDIKAADMNGDGVPDLAVVNNSGASISVLLGTNPCNGTFQPSATYATANTPNALGVGDLSGDGFQDVVTSNGGASISVLLNSGAGMFPTHVDYRSNSYPSYAVGMADFNNDGRLDVMVPNFNAAGVSLYLGNGDGTLKSAAVSPAGSNPDALAVADFNNDGLLDVVVLNEFANSASVLLQSSVIQPKISPTSLAFPLVQAGSQSAPMSVTITNQSGNPLTINPFTLGGINPDQYVITGTTCPSSLAAQASCMASVAFAPTVGLPTSATLNVNDSAGTQTVALAGRGQLTIGISPIDITFGNVAIGMQSAPMTSTITNASGVNLDIYSIEVTGHDIQDYPESNNCPSSLPPNQTCTVTITFAPVAIRERRATVIIMSNSSTPKRGIVLAGTGTEITFAPPSLDFGTIQSGMMSTMNVTFSNSGPTVLPIHSVVINGPNSHVFSQTNNCNGNIPANGSCVFSVTFFPKAPGAAQAQMKVTDDDPTSPQVVPLTGMATAAAKH